MYWTILVHLSYVIEYFMEISVIVFGEKLRLDLQHASNRVSILNGKWNINLHLYIFSIYGRGPKKVVHFQTWTLHWVFADTRFWKWSFQSTPIALTVLNSHSFSVCVYEGVRHTRSHQHWSHIQYNTTVWISTSPYITWGVQWEVAVKSVVW